MSASDASPLPHTSSPSTSASRDPSLPSAAQLREAQSNQEMADVSTDAAATNTEERQATEEPATTTDPTPDVEAQPGKSKRKAKCKKPEHKHKQADSPKKKKTVKKSKDESSDSSTSESEASDSDSSEESSSEDEKVKKKLKAKRAAQQKKLKDKKRKKSKKQESDSGEDESASNQSSSEEEITKKKKKPTKKSKKAAKLETEEEAEDSDDASGPGSDLEARLTALKLQMAQLMKSKKRKGDSKQVKSSKKASKKEDAASYKRVDQLWDNTIHNYKLKESAEDDDGEFAEYAFLVRRTFNWENKYLCTVIDIKAKALRAALTEVMKDCKSVSLEAEEPTIDPNILFLYLEQLRTYCKKTLKSQIKKTKKRKEIKKLELQRSLMKTLISYIDEDYADTKKTLYPLLAAGNITFDLLWALFHPNEVAVTSTYGVWDEPRCFKVEYANKFCSMTRGDWYCIEGKYLEYDGKGFGYGDFEVDIESFKGPRKITSLATYPLRYHKDPDAVKKQIIERGKRFVTTEGMNYRFHKGLAFMKKKKQVLKININGRIMIDPAIFRRINPNYPVSYIKPKDSEELFGGDDDDSEDCSCCGDDSDNEDAVGRAERLKNRDDDGEPKFKYKLVTDEKGEHHLAAVEVDSDGEPIRKEVVDKKEEKLTGKHEFTEEELLLTSSVVLGFAFSEKLWLEFTLAGVKDIEYNDDAFDTLVLPPEQKSIVKALVTSHKFHAAKTIDDVVQGKGKGLVAVLHGPPGTGKTLTAEGISELLKCPLYMVSAGELGTDPARLEHELQKILDIAHSWGAVLLLDEADVFLEKREVHDIHRNALVSIFLRQLEYFQGILFLTTNRVETFDEAFQSRIHLPLKYTELSPKAKKTIWKTFIDMVRKTEGTEVAEFGDWDLEILSRNQLNGRQIKNVVRTAQALALNEGSKLDLALMRRVLDVEETFDRDLKGGTGYIDAMRSYT